MTREFLDMAADLEKRATDPKHRRGAVLLKDAIVTLMSHGYLPDSFEFDTLSQFGASTILNPEQEQIVPQHSQFSFSLETNTAISRKSGASEMFTLIESELVVAMLRRMGRITSPHNLSQEVSYWKGREIDAIGNVKVQVNRIRSKLDRLGLHDDNFPHGYVLTSRGRGYGIFDPAIEQHVMTSRRISNVRNRKMPFSVE